MSYPKKGHWGASQQSKNGPFRRAWLSLAGATAALFLFPPAIVAEGQPELVIRPAPQPVVPLTAKEKQRVQEAINRGVTYLKGTQLRTGSWIIGINAPGDPRVGNKLALHYAAGFASLGGLALLQSGVPAKDPAVQAAARFVRLSGPGLFRTYDLALAVLFLDQLGEGREGPSHGLAGVGSGPLRPLVALRRRPEAALDRSFSPRSRA